MDAFSKFIQILQALGPFSTPLCIAMAFVFRYVVVPAFNKMETRATDAELSIANLQNQRAETAGKFATAMAEHGEATRDAIRELVETNKRVLQDRQDRQPPQQTPYGEGRGPVRLPR